MPPIPQSNLGSWVSRIRRCRGPGWDGVYVASFCHLAFWASASTTSAASCCILVFLEFFVLLRNVAQACANSNCGVFELDKARHQMQRRTTTCKDMLSPAFRPFFFPAAVLQPHFRPIHKSDHRRLNFNRHGHFQQEKKMPNQMQGDLLRFVAIRAIDKVSKQNISGFWPSSSSPSAAGSW